MNEFVSNILSATPAVIAMIEALRYWNIFPRIARLRRVSKQSIHVLLSNRISDHWKEISLRYYGYIVMKEAVVLFGQVFLSLALLVGIYGLLGATLIDSKFELISSILTVETQVVMIMVSIVYLALKHRKFGG